MQTQRHLDDGTNEGDIGMHDGVYGGLRQGAGVQRALRTLRAISAVTLVAAVLAAATGCDSRRIERLEEGVATEADVRARFGQPEKIWDAPGGGRTLEYNRNPAGHENYMITIGTDGKMTSLRQVLVPSNFAKIVPGMPMEDVRKALGKPAKQATYPLKNETAWEWRWMEMPNTSKLFTVTFDRDWMVARTAVSPDPEANENRGGPN